MDKYGLYISEIYINPPEYTALLLAIKHSMTVKLT